MRPVSRGDSSINLRRTTNSSRKSDMRDRAAEAGQPQLEETRRTSSGEPRWARSAVDGFFKSTLMT
jgi:hypothetical protein